ncbi:hypothetical protein ONZ45_g9397 [Pleurotus djamor]|nr:hypothetical protein ONZ45_g9397 [Pleurotus djamor]
MRIFTDIEAQKLIDEKIAHLEVELYSLKSQRNSLSAISQLPDDVLSLIFVEYKVGTVEDSAWLNITGICQRWRAIILSTPGFWSFITTHDLGFTDTMMKRAKSIPLTLQFSVPWVESDGARAGFNAILSNSSHVGNISFSLGSNTSQDRRSLLRLISQVEAHDFPLLHRLRIASANPHDFSYFLKQSIWSPNSNFNSFRSLELSDVIFPATNIPLLPSLTNLLVQCDSSSKGLSLAWITQFLRRTPNLETLDLNIVDSQGHNEATDPFPISLPALQDVEVVMSRIDEAILFDFLDVPTTAAMCITFQDEVFTYDTTVGFSSLETFLQNQTRVASISQMLVTFEEPLARLSLFDSQPTIAISLPFRSSMLQHYTAMFLAIPLSRVEEIIIQTIDSTSPLIWAPFLSTPRPVWHNASSASLLYLEFDGPVLPPSDFPSLPSLISLCIYHASPSISWITRFLLNTPNIEQVRLTLVSPDHDSPPPSFVSLPKLDYLQITSASIAESKLFDYLDFPGAATVVADFPNAHTGEPVDLSSFEKHYGRSTTEAVPVGTAFFTVDNTRGRFELALKCAANTRVLTRLRLPFVEASAAAYLSLCSKLPLSAIPRLRISRISSPAIALLWSTILPSFTNLTELVLDKTIHTVLNFLLIPKPTPNSPYCNAMLKTIVATNPPWDGRTAAALSVLFKQRRKMGLPIDRYIVKGGGISWDILAGLKDFVDVQLNGELLQ